MKAPHVPISTGSAPESEGEESPQQRGTLQEEIAGHAGVHAHQEVEKSTLGNILNAMRDGVAIIGSRHDVQYVNPALERDFGPVGDRVCHEYFLGLPTPCPWCRKREVISGRSVSRAWKHAPSGRTYDVFSTPIRSRDGQMSELVILTDITERERVADELRESRRLIERIANTSPDIIYVYDLAKQAYSYINRKLVEVMGYTPTSLADGGSLRASQIVHPDDSEIREKRLARLAAALDGEVLETEYRIRRADGEYRWFGLRDSVFSRSPDGAVRQIVGVARDVTDIKRAERALLEATEVERRRFGQDLHDGLGQALTGVALFAKRLERQVEGGALPDPADMRQLVDLVVGTMGQAKNLAAGLFPAALEAAGLRAALEDLARSTTATFEASCVVEGEAAAPALPPFRAIHLFRIAQEAVHNAARHGRPKVITITLRETAEETMLEVLDDGEGIGDDVLQRGGLGLLSMRHRARLIGATLEIRRAAGHGTILTCRLSAVTNS